MKNTITKKSVIVIVALAMLLSVTFCVLQSSRDKGVNGNWEVEGAIKDYELKFSDFGEYEYFNISLSEDGVINIFSFPENFAVLGTYSLLEKKGDSYTYMANLFTYNENRDVNPFGTKFVYNVKEDCLYIFFSEDDGLFFQRTEELTTVESITTETTTIENNSDNGIENHTSTLLGQDDDTYTENTLNSEIDMSYYKASCEHYIDSKNLVRFEQEYLNRNFCYIGRVLTCGDGNVYAIITDENFDGIYRENLIYVQDCREDRTKILEEDIVTVYCTFTGVSADNYPCFDLYYADIEGVQ